MNIELFSRCLLNEIAHYKSKASPLMEDVKAASASDPSIVDIWLEPLGSRVLVRRDHGSPYGSKIAGLDTFYHAIDSLQPEPFWCALYLTSGKTASLWENLRGVSGWTDRFYPPSPLAAMIASGILGAGLGYGGSTILSRFLPGKWDKKKFRHSGLLAGAALGAAPGALESLKSILIDQPVTDGSHMKEKRPELQTDANSDKAASYAANPLPHSPRYSSGPTIDTDAMLNTVWRSPMLSPQLSPKEKSLFTGAVLGSQQIAGSPYVTPRDMARLTAGMGVGYASGLVAGKILGALTGLPGGAQDALAQGGMYAGIVKSVLPMIYGVGR